MNDLRVIAITHKSFPLETIGLFHLNSDTKAERLKDLKLSSQLPELMYLSTCNRVEIVFTLPHYVCPGVTAQILQQLAPTLDPSAIREIAGRAERYNGIEAAEHLLNVASSMDSLVIGEREIITQLRKAYEECRELGLTGDDLRIVTRQCLHTAKEVFTDTELSRRPVSVVSLAWQEFCNYGVKRDARILMIGAGQVIRNFNKFLAENGYNNITIANRSIEKASDLASLTSGKAISLDSLPSYIDGFDVLVSCTGSDSFVVSAETYGVLLGGDTAKKLVIDLAIPADIESTIPSMHNVHYVDMNLIRQRASENIQMREQALTDCRPIIARGLKEFEKVWQARQIELAMQSIPEAIKDIRNTALGSVFARDLEDLDENAREILEKIMNYMEKKYISIPMKMAREVLMNEVSRN